MLNTGREMRVLPPHPGPLPEREIRIPNSEARKKPEFRIPTARISDGPRTSAFGLRISFGFRASEFGFQVQGFNARRFHSENSLPVKGRGSRDGPRAGAG